MHVLVCDDDRESAEALAALLTIAAPLPLAFTVEVGFDGRQAVELARETRPDVVILDLEMPGLDGFEAAAAIRQAVSESPPLLIAVSGAPLYVNAAEEGSTFDHALRKPLDFNLLLHLVFGDSHGSAVLARDGREAPRQRQ